MKLLYIFLFWLLIFILIKEIIRMILKRRAQAILMRFRGKKIVRIESFAYLCKDQGPSQKGRGILVLTEQELYFRTWIPDKEIVIPLGAIARVEAPFIAYNKLFYFPCLRVSFKSGPESVTSFSWRVKDCAQWQSALETTVKQAGRQ